MELLKEKILSQGSVIDENILKVDAFLNHNIDIKLMQEIGKEFARRFKDDNITKVVTVESSGIAPAYATALELGVDLVFARKNKSLTLNDQSTDLIFTKIFSYTKNIETTIYISKKYITPNDNVLLIDDFLANGEVGFGLYSIVKEVGASIAGLGIVIEKSFQKGRKDLNAEGIRVESLARIISLKNNVVEFLE